MPVPNFQEFLWPLLELAGDGQEHTLTEAAELVARRFALSETERNEPLPSGKQPSSGTVCRGPVPICKKRSCSRAQAAGASALPSVVEGC